MRTAWIRRSLGLGCWVAFVVTFDPAKHEVAPLLLWLLAVACAVLEGTTLGGFRGVRWHLQRTELLAFATLLAVFCASWLPFYDNWRWVHAGDSLPWYSMGAHAAENGLSRSILSVWGIDRHFTFLHTLSANFLLFVFEPSFFWHRVGKLVTTCASLTAIFIFFRAVAGTWWGLAVCACIATNHLFLWFSHMSFFHVDSFFFYFGVLSLALAITRAPTAGMLWTSAGLCGGLAAYFTQTSWSAVGAAGLTLLGTAFRQRRPRELIAAAITGVAVITPLILQWEVFLAMNTSLSQTLWDEAYLRRIFREIVLFPYTSPYRKLGLYDGVLRPPLNVAYFPGVAIAALSLIPPFRRRLHLHVAIPWLFVLLAIEVVLLTLTNNSHPIPSSKRMFSQIPLWVFFGTLPIALVLRLIAQRLQNRKIPLAIAFALFGWYAVAQISIIVSPAQFLYGGNKFDGVVELRQRFPSKQVAFFSSQADIAKQMGPETWFHRMYKIADTVRPIGEWSADRVSQALLDREIVCYEHAVDSSRWESVAEDLACPPVPLPLLNSNQIRCFTCPDDRDGDVIP